MGHKLAEIQRIQSILVTIYLLELVGATAVTSLGWAACRMLQIDWIPSAPLWFAGYLLVYNLDRLYPDPADLINIPIRSSKTEELRAARIGLAFLSAAVLLVWSLLNDPMVAGIGTRFRGYHSAVLLSAGSRSGISTEGSSLC